MTASASDRRAKRSGPLQNVVRRFQPLRRQLRSHYLFEVAGETIAYCYIRKNACSAFKRLILDQAGYQGDWDDAIDFLAQFNAPNLAAAKGATWRIYVYRDPFERMVSLFRNKLVARERSSDFIADFQQVTGREAEHATFEEFVTIYLTATPGDPHTWSQASQLLPMPYNCVSTFDTLFDDMKSIVGDELADRYFARPANQSSAALYDDASLELPVRLLRERYDETGELPSSAALDQPVVRAAIHRLYRDDYALAPVT